MADDVVGFVKADGERLINGEGREILLRGVGFGGWLLPEGYMWRFPKQGDRPRRISRGAHASTAETPGREGP